MVISESAFLLLEPDEKRKNICTLSIYATLYALQRIERDLDTPNKIIFYWHRPDRKVNFSLKGKEKKTLGATKARTLCRESKSLHKPSAGTGKATWNRHRTDSTEQA